MSSDDSIEILSGRVLALSDSIVAEKDARHTANRQTRAAIGVVVVLVLMVVALGWHQRSSDQARRRHDAQGEIDQQYVSCLRGNELRDLMKTQTIVAFGSGGSLDLTGIPSFQNLDPATQAFFRDIAKATAQPAGSQSTRDAILADIQAQIRDCETEWHGHTPGLHLDHSKR